MFIRFLKENRWVLFLLLFTTFFVSCEKDNKEPDVQGPYKTGVFVTNEGPFQTGTGTVSFYNRDTKEVTPDIFQKENASRVLGNIVQSMTIIKDRAYIVVNNAKTVEVVERGTFKTIATIEGFDQPRYILGVADNKAYVSQWGATGLDGSIKVVNLESNTIESSIVVGTGPEEMTQIGDRVYVVNSGGFGVDSLVSVIDVSSNTVTQSIEVAKNPVGIVVDKNQDIWVLSRGVTDWANPANSIKGALTKISNNEVALNIELLNGAGNLAINKNKDQLFYTLNAQLFDHQIGETALRSTPMLSRNFYSVAVDPTTNMLFCADAKDFQSNGEVFIYGMDGVVRDSFEVGIIPGGFVFQ